MPNLLNLSLKIFELTGHGWLWHNYFYCIIFFFPPVSEKQCLGLEPEKNVKNTEHRKYRKMYLLKFLFETLESVSPTIGLTIMSFQFTPAQSLY